jgi:23S rRNA (adenine2503-C2)-methyltransferase
VETTSSCSSRRLLDLPPEKWEFPGTPAFRTKQIRQWIFEKGALDFQEMSNLPANMREDLSNEWQLRPMELARLQGSADTTRKFLWRLHDGQYIESVLIPATPGSDGERADRLTLCVSSQVGCALGCKFCASGLDGLLRNLTPGEIVGQVLMARKEAGRRIDNLVFMGMGEPLANLPNLLPALDTILSPEGLGIGARHITLSTSGLIPRILQLAEHPAQLRLAISLHGADDHTRRKIMPINDRYPVAELLKACETFINQRKKIITFEYILIHGINDDLAQATLLARHARKLRAKINLIPYNSVEGLEWRRPNLKRIEAFRRRVESGGAKVTVRMEKGHDIDAACGQLRLRQKLEEKNEE